MRLLYHFTVLPPAMPAAEALSQETAALRGRFGGELIYLNPNIESPIPVPRLFFGIHRLRELWRRERQVDLHHFFNPDPYPFPLLLALRRPVLYTITSGVGERPASRRYFSRLGAVAVSDERSYRRLQEWGIHRAVLVRPGIDTARFSHQPLRLGEDFSLMMASAPWTREQFHSKGIHALLGAARQAPWLKLVLLWRGVLAEEIERLVREMGLEGQVRVINRAVDVNQVLSSVHASVVLAASAGIVKSYPHSLLDSLAAGKPVLVSQAIPMADYVGEVGCGVVVDTVSAESVLAAIERLRAGYEAMSARAREVGQRDFSQEAMLASYEQAYRVALGGTA